MKKQTLYKKIAKYPKELFGDKLSEIILVGERRYPIEEIPNGQTYTYELHILVDLTPRELEKYTEEIAKYYKNKTKNSHFKLEAKIFNTLHYKMRNHFILPLGNVVVYRKEPLFSKTHGRMLNHNSHFSIKKIM